MKSRRGEGLYTGIRNYLDRIEEALEVGDTDRARQLVREAREFFDSKYRRTLLRVDDILQRVPKEYVKKAVESLVTDDVMKTWVLKLNKRAVAVVGYLLYKGGQATIDEMARDLDVAPSRVRMFLSSDSVKDYISVDEDVIRLKKGFGR